MKRAKHEPGPIVCCPACITALERDRMPWQSSYHDVALSDAAKAVQRRHDAAIRRAEKHEAYTSLGMRRVRGALGGTYYE